MLLKQIFVEDGLPINMHIHHSIANVNVRATLGQRIRVSDAMLGALSRCGLMSCETTLAAFWRGSNSISTICPCDSSRSEYRGVPASGQVLSRRSGQVHRIISVGQEVCGEGRSAVYTIGLQEPRRTPSGRRVRGRNLDSVPIFSDTSLDAHPSPKKTKNTFVNG